MYPGKKVHFILGTLLVLGMVLLLGVVFVSPVGGDEPELPQMNEECRELMKKVKVVKIGEVSGWRVAGRKEADRVLQCLGRREWTGAPSKEREPFAVGTEWGGTWMAPGSMEKYMRPEK